MEKYAIIKLSAQTIKLSLIDVTSNGYYNLFDEITETVKLGMSVEQNGLIMPNVINEALTLLKLFRKICDANNVSKIVAIAESFIKVAKNQKSFFDEIYNNTGFAFSILSPEEEVKVIYKGITNTIDISKALAIYIAPNQTHIIQFNRRTIMSSQSINLGYLNLAEKFVDELNPEEKMKKMIAEFTQELKNNEILSDDDQEITYIGVGTVFESIGKLARKITKYPLELANNYVLTRDAFNSVYEVVNSLDLDKTKKLKGITEDRADALASGVAILKALFDMQKFNATSICANCFDEGVVAQNLPNDAQDRVPSDMLSVSLETIRTFYDRELSNTLNVYNLAVILFKQLKVIHKLPRNYVKPLRIAASMYNCGTRIGFDNYANNSFEIIVNSKLYGASQKDILLAAFACKAQNLENLNLAEWLKYKDILTEEDLDAVRKLGVIVNLASSLDKSRMGNVQDITCDILGDSIIMKTIVNADASFDIMQAQKVGTNFKKVFKKTLQVI
ncbi:MAG: hypothetical protein J6T74_09865 [Clostridia bacterium]|nr:hypothetical protein [Clostridia bacterium]